MGEKSRFALRCLQCLLLACRSIEMARIMRATDRIVIALQDSIERVFSQNKNQSVLEQLITERSILRETLFVFVRRVKTSLYLSKTFAPLSSRSGQESGKAFQQVAYLSLLLGGRASHQ